MLASIQTSSETLKGGSMKAYLVDLIDSKTQVHQRIWVKTQNPISPQEMAAYVEQLEGLKIESPKLVSIREKTLPSRIRQELVEKVFSVYAK
jgi:hypothetical protein